MLFWGTLRQNVKDRIDAFFYKIILVLLIMFTNSKLFSYEEGIALKWRS